MIDRKTYFETREAMEEIRHKIERLNAWKAPDNTPPSEALKEWGALMNFEINLGSVLSNAARRLIESCKPETNQGGVDYYSKFVEQVDCFDDWLFDVMVGLKHQIGDVLEDANKAPKNVCSMPDELNTPEARALLDRLVEHGYCDFNYRWCKAKSLAVVAACIISQKLFNENRWKPFETLWEMTGMAQSYSNIYKRKEADASKVENLDNILEAKRPFYS